MTPAGLDYGALHNALMANLRLVRAIADMDAHGPHCPACSHPRGQHVAKCPVMLAREMMSAAPPLVRNAIAEEC